MPYVPSSTSDLVILGGTGAVSAVTENGLRAMPSITSVTRYGGANRYETGRLVAQYGAAEGLEWDGLGIATGAAFPDALSGGAMLGRLGSVMLLTDGEWLSTSTQQTLHDHKSEIYGVYFLGGTGALSQTVRDQVETILE